MSEPGQQSQAKPARPARPAPRLEGRAQLVRVPKPGTGSWRRKMHRHRKCAGRVLRGLNGGERSRADDAFRPPSPAPFAFVTEPAPFRERDRVLGWRLPSHQLQSCERQDFASHERLQSGTHVEPAKVAPVRWRSRSHKAPEASQIFRKGSVWEQGRDGAWLPRSGHACKATQGTTTQPSQIFPSG